MTRLTFTSVVCADNITETSSSRSERNRSAIVASGCSAISRSTIGPDARLLRPDATTSLGDEAPCHAAILALTVEAQRKFGPAQTTSSAGQPAHANSLGRGGNRPAWMRAIASDSSASSSGSLIAPEGRLDELVRPLEELVDDLDLLGARAEARERVDEPLQPVLGLDDLGGRALAEHVRLEVGDERAAAVQVEDVEHAVEEHAVVLECERPLGRDARRAPRARAASVDPQYASTRPPIRASSSPVAAGYHVSTWSSDGAAGDARSTRSSSRCTASPISLAASAASGRESRRRLPSTGRSPASRSA